MTPLEQMIEAAPEGGEVILEPGVTHDVGDLTITKCVTLRGPHSGWGSPAQAPRIKGNLTLWANGLRLEGAWIEGTDATKPAIAMKQTASLRHLTIRGQMLHGVSITADARGSIAAGTRYENANSWEIHRVSVNGAVEDGLFIDGPDVNAGRSSLFSAIACGRHGIFDSSFLGNTHDSPHVSACKGAAYKTDNANARHVFVNAYRENDTPEPEMSALTVVVGGGGMRQSVGGQYIGEGRLSPYWVEGDLRMHVGDWGGSSIDFLPTGDHPRGWSYALWNAAAGTLDFAHARLGSRRPIRLTTNLTTLTDMAGNQIPGGEVLFEKGFWVHVGGGKCLQITPAMLVGLVE